LRKSSPPRPSGGAERIGNRVEPAVEEKNGAIYHPVPPGPAIENDFSKIISHRLIKDIKKGKTKINH
jgi:hypothetical protein